MKTTENNPIAAFATLFKRRSFEDVRERVAAGSADPTAIYAAADALTLIWIPVLGAMTAAAVTISNHQSEIARCKAQAAQALENAEWERRMAALYSANTETSQPRGQTHE